jgi:hypothetical protein
MSKSLEYIIFNSDGDILQVGTAQNRRMGRSMARRFGGMVTFPKAGGLPDPSACKIEKRRVVEKPNLAELRNDEAWRSLRGQRDALLAASDFSQMPDFPGDRAAWQTYRQALRDLPSQVRDPADVEWPQKPG